MKLRLPLSLIVAIGLATNLSATITSSDDGSTRTFTGSQSSGYYLLSSNLGGDTITTLVFSSVGTSDDSGKGAWFSGGEISKNIEFVEEGLYLGGGASAATTKFTGSVSGSGNFTINTDNALNSQDFVFTGDLTSYTGSINFKAAKFSNGTTDLGNNSEGILLFGNNTVAQGAVTGEEVGSRTITNVVGTGSITTTGVLRFQYAADTTYDYLTVSNAISARYITIGGTSNDATYQFTGNITGNNSTATNNTLEVKADTTFKGALTNFGTLKIGADKTVNLNMGTKTFSVSSIKLENGAALYVDSNSTLTLGSDFVLSREGTTGAATVTIEGKVVGAQNFTVNAGITLDLSEGHLFVNSSGGAAHNNSKNLTVNEGGTVKLNNLSWGSSGSLGGLDTSKERRVLNGGTLIITGSNNTVDAGIKVTGSGKTSQFLVDKADTTLTLNNTESDKALDIASGATLGIGGEGNMTFAQKKIMGSGSLTKVGAGTVIINSSNTYSGGTSVSEGILTAGSVNSLGTGSVSVVGGVLNAEAENVAGSGSITVTGGTVNIGNENAFETSSSVVFNGGEIAVKSENFSRGENKYFSLGHTTLSVHQDNASHSWSSVSDYELTEETEGTVFSAKDGESITMDGVGRGVGKLVKEGDGILYIGGETQNTYSGGTDISSGTLVSNKMGALGTGSVSVSSGATLQLNAGSDNSYVFSNVLSGAGSLKKDGEGTITLNSTNESYTGAIIVSSGTLVAGADKALGVGGAVSVSSGATLVLNHETALGENGLLSLADSSSLVLGLIPTTDKNPTYAFDSVSLNGGVTLKYQGQGTQFGTISANSWTLDDGATLTFELSLLGDVTNGDKATLVSGLSYTGSTEAFMQQFFLSGLANTRFKDSTLSFSEGNIYVNFVGSAYDLTWNGSSSDVWSSSENNTGWQHEGDSGNIAFVGGDKVTFKASAELDSVTISGSVNPTTITVNADSGFTFKGDSSALITGNSALTKNGSGTLTIENEVNMDYTGATVVTNGSLVINSASAKSTGNVTLAEGTVLQFGTGNYDYSGVISGEGRLVFAGGTLELGGTSANIFTGGTTISQGTLNLNKEAALGTGNITMSGGVLNANAERSLDNNSLEILNGTLNATTSNALGSSIITMTGGMLSAIVDSALGSSVITISGEEASLNASGVGSLGSSKITLSAGTLTISGSNAGKEATIIMNNGTLNATVDNALGSSHITMTGGILNATVDNALGSSTITIDGEGAFLNATGISSLGSSIIDVKKGSLSVSGTDTVQNILNKVTFTGGVLQLAENALNWDSSSGGTHTLGDGTSSGTVEVRSTLSNCGNLTVKNGMFLDLSDSRSKLSGLSKITIEGIVAIKSFDYGGDFYQVQDTSANRVLNGGTLMISQGGHTGQGFNVTATGENNISQFLYNPDEDNTNTELILRHDSKNVDIATGAILQIGGSGNIGFKGVDSVSGTHDKAAKKITGNGALEKIGTGTLTIESTNTYTGGTTVKEGTLNADAVGALGTGAIIVSGGTLNVKNGLTNAFGNSSVTISSGTINAGGNASLGNGTLTITGGKLSNLGISSTPTEATTFDSPEANATLQQVVVDLETGKSATLENVQCELISGEAGKTITIGSGQSLTVSGSESQTMLTFNDVTSSFFTLNAGATLTLEGTLVLNIGSLEPNADASWIYTLNFADKTLGGSIDLENVNNIIVQKGDEELYNWSGSELSAVKNSLATTGTLTFTIPEPSTATLSLLALAGLLARRRRCA